MVAERRDPPTRPGSRQALKKSSKALLALTTEAVLPFEKRERLHKELSRLAESMGMRGVVVEGGMEVGIHSDIRPLIEEQLAEQRKTNELLVMLIEAMAEAEGDPDAEPATYMDGTPVHG